MSDHNVFETLKKDYPELIADKYPFPDAFKGDEGIKAIVLGADPTHIVNGIPKSLKQVFGLHLDKSPYWRSIQRNIEQLSSISKNNLYVQNICRNYFTKETSKNKHWVKIARDYWSRELKKELDDKFDKNIPILMTTEFILHSLLKNNRPKVKAFDIYTSCRMFNKDDNLLSRDLIAFYRHSRYSLKNWEEYRNFVDKRLR